MRSYLSVVLLVLITNTLSAQQRDLTFYINKAKDFNISIKEAQNDNRIAKLDLDLQRASLLKPEINVEGNVLIAPIISKDNNLSQFKLVTEDVKDYLGYDLAATDGGQFRSVISFNQPLLVGSSLKTFYNKSDISLRYNNNLISLTNHEVEKEVSQQYILCLKSLSLAETNSQLLEEISNELKIMQKLVENAVYKQSDLLLLEIECENFRINYVAAESEYLNNLYELNLLCGINDTSRVELVNIEPQLITMPTSVTGFSNSFKIDSMMLLADLNVSGLKYKPRVNLFADAGLNAVYLPRANRLGFSTGLTFAWNIFDGNQRDIQKQTTLVKLQTVENRKANLLTQQMIHKAAILNNINSLDKQIQLIDGQLKQYDQLLKMNRVFLATGDISVIDYRTILRDLASHRQQRQSLDLEKKSLIINYNYWNF